MPAKPDDLLCTLPQLLPLPLPLAKPTLTFSSEPQFHPQASLQESEAVTVGKAGEWSSADELRLCELHN